MHLANVHPMPQEMRRRVVVVAARTPYIRLEGVYLQSSDTV